MSQSCKAFWARRRRAAARAAAAVIAVMGMVSVRPAAANDALHPSVDVLLGVPINAHSPLRVEQSGQPDLELTARWRTRPFEIPLFYGLRVGLGQARGGWALDLLHHKLTLENNPPEVQSFSLTHGYNLLTAQRLWLCDGWRAMLGAGVVLPHVENTVRGRRFPENRGLFGAGYHLAGPAVTAGIGRRVPLSGPVHLSLELRTSVSRVWVDVVDGEAALTHAAVYLLAGLAIAPR